MCSTHIYTVTSFVSPAERGGSRATQYTVSKYLVLIKAVRSLVPDEKLEQNLEDSAKENK